MSTINGDEKSRNAVTGSKIKCSEDLPQPSSSSTEPPKLSPLLANVMSPSIGEPPDRNRSDSHINQSYSAYALPHAPNAHQALHQPTTEAKTESLALRQSPPTMDVIESKNADSVTPSKIHSLPSSLQQASPNTNESGGVVHPTPVRHASARSMQASTPSSTSGNPSSSAVPPPTAYGWIPGGSPPHYHPHPMHMYHHPPPAIYASPDSSSWNKSGGTPTSTTNTTATGGSGTKQQLTPTQPPPIPYPWPPHHLPPYPYAPHPHHPYSGTPANGSRYPQAHLYSWPPPQGPPSLNRTTASRGSAKPNASNSKSTSSTKVKIPSSLSAKGSAKVGNADPEENARKGGALSPREIALHHRVEVQDMGCTCKKTRCLKLYCQCFGVRVYCGSNCRCLQCYNTKKHEKHRKDAMRNILSRNPGAFDIKFKKDLTATIVVPPRQSLTAMSTVRITQPAPPATKSAAIELNSGAEVAPVKLETIATNAAADVTEASRALAHRLGCKCRKSACMKKYCECFAANVKCSASCRCMGCKNMGGPGADFRDHQAAMGMMAAAAAHHAMQYHRSHQLIGSANQAMRQFVVVNGNSNVGLPPRQPQMQTDTSRSSSVSNDPWMAAQSLTNMKRGSPGNHGTATSHQQNAPYSMGISPITKPPGTMEIVQENVSMPSLSSSSEGTSPGDGAALTSHLKAMSTPESFKGETNALLLAAVAMTEFGQSPPPTSSMLSPDTIRTCTNPRNLGNDLVNGDLPPGARGEKSDNPSSKRSINFDNLPDGNGTDVTKKVKSAAWM